MDDFLKSLKLGFLLRNLVAGAYFLASYAYTSGGTISWLHSFKSESFLALVALLIGITVYCIHRAFCYPILEQILNSKWAERARKERFPIISDRSIGVLKGLWGAGCEGAAKNKAIASHVETWADYTHLLYATSWAIASGSITSAIYCGGSHAANWWLVSIVAFLVVLGFVSDWRLHAVREKINLARAMPGA